MKFPLRELRLYLLGTAVVVLVFFSFIELTTRIVSLARGSGFSLALHELDAGDDAISSIYEFHPFMGFVFRSNAQIQGGHPRQDTVASVYTDRYGFLSNGENLSLPKAANEIRIATVGASTTASLNLSYEDNWPGRLAEMLQAQFPNRKITVINAAIPGFNTAQSIGNLALRVMPFKPDLVIIYHAYNDLKVVRSGIELRSDYSNVHKKPYGSFKKPNALIRALNKSMFYVRTRNAYREFKQRKGGLSDPADSKRLDEVTDDAARHFAHNIRMLVAIAQGGGGHVVLSSFATLHALDINATPDSMSRMQLQELHSLLSFTKGLSVRGIFKGISRYNAILEDLARESGAGWVDNANLIPHSDEYFLDRVHFSRAGTEKMAENFLPVVAQQIQLRLALDAQTSTQAIRRE